MKTLYATVGDRQRARHKIEKALKIPIVIAFLPNFLCLWMKKGKDHEMTINVAEDSTFQQFKD